MTAKAVSRLLSRLFRLLSIVVGIGLLSGSAVASEAELSEDVLPPAYLQMKAGRQALISGEFSAEVRIIQRNTEEAAVEVWLLQHVHCVFDHASGSLLFERRFVDASDSYKERNTGPSGKPVRLGDVSFIKTPNEVVSYADGSLLVNINPGGTPAPSTLSYFDVRRVGMMNLVGYQDGASFESSVEAMERYPVREEHIDDSLSRLTMGNPRHPTVLLINKNGGYTPLKMELGVKRRDGKAKVGHVSEVSWHERSSVYVPETAFVEWNIPTGGITREEYKFDWKRVNQPMLPDDFSVSALDLPMGTVVWNRTQGVPFIERRIGVDSLPRARIPFPESGSGNRTRFLFLVANVIVVITLAALLIARHARKA